MAWRSRRVSNSRLPWSLPRRVTSRRGSNAVKVNYLSWESCDGRADSLPYELLSFSSSITMRLTQHVCRRGGPSCATRYYWRSL